MNASLSRRLKRLEEGLLPNDEPMKMEIQYICPLTKEVVNSIAIEIGGGPQYQRTRDRFRYRDKYR
jgi:hypothetical protein